MGKLVRHFGGLPVSSIVFRTSNGRKSSGSIQSSARTSILTFSFSAYAASSEEPILRHPAQLRLPAKCQFGSLTSWTTRLSETSGADEMHMLGLRRIRNSKRQLTGEEQADSRNKSYRNASPNFQRRIFPTIILLPSRRRPSSPPEDGAIPPPDCITVGSGDAGRIQVAAANARPGSRYDIIIN